MVRGVFEDFGNAFRAAVTLAGKYFSEKLML